MEKKYVIDTDIGDDVDDAFAVMLAAKSEMDVLGVTTVFRNAKQRAQMTQYLLRLIGRGDIPVYAGVDRALIQKIENLLPREMIEEEMKNGHYTLPQYAEEMSSEKVRTENAVDFLIGAAEKYGKDLTIVAIGPLTNMAIAIRKAPEAMSRIAELRLIGGNYLQRKPEWNVACDPEAARIVFTSGIPVKAIGIDTTMRCPLSDERMEKLRSLGNESANLICDMIRRWTAHYGYERPVMHDPLAIANCLEDGIVGFTEKNVTAGLTGAERGCTLPSDRENSETGRISVATCVDADAFFRIFDRYIFEK